MNKPRFAEFLSSPERESSTLESRPSSFYPSSDAIGKLLIFFLKPLHPSASLASWSSSSTQPLVVGLHLDLSSSFTCS
jgi:hypothetical protein